MPKKIDAAKTDATSTPVIDKGKDKLEPLHAPADVTLSDGTVTPLGVAIPTFTQRTPLVKRMALYALLLLGLGYVISDALESRATTKLLQTQENTLEQQNGTLALIERELGEAKAQNQELIDLLTENGFVVQVGPDTDGDGIGDIVVVPVPRGSSASGTISPSVASQAPGGGGAASNDAANEPAQSSPRPPAAAEPAPTRTAEPAPEEEPVLLPSVEAPTEGDRGVLTEDPLLTCVEVPLLVRLCP